MPKVELPAADWYFIEMLLGDNPGYISDPLLAEIGRQLNSQEY